MAKFILGEMRRLINPILSFFVIWIVESSSAAYVRITQDGPGVLGSTISLRAELFDDHGILQGNGTQHRFSWSDNAMPPHKYTEEGEFSISYWNVTYASHQYSPGKYEVEVRVTKWLGFFWWDVSSSRINIDVTVMLNGQVDLIQNQTSLGAEYIAVNQEVHHTIQLSQPDSKMLASNDTIVHTYWFLDCEYFGSSQDRSFSHNYTKEDLDKVRVIRAIVVAGKEANNTIEESDFGWSDDVNATTNADVTTAPDPHCRDFPIVPKDPNKLYGYFTRNVTATAPVQSVHVDGQTWLKNGDVLHLNVTCSGSSPFYHCVIFFAGDYNVTGKEKCQKARPTSTCNVVFTRLMNTGTKYTALFIIGNRVSKTVTPVGITRYSEKHHPQLSVIIVPISCSVVAIVLIIFGVAYYIQSRNRFKIEVADFDFSRNSDTEYKTFKERLRDAVSSAFTRVKDDEYSEEGPSHYSGGGSVWSPTRKSRPPREGGLLYENSDSDQ